MKKMFVLLALMVAQVSMAGTVERRAEEKRDDRKVEEIRNVERANQTADSKRGEIVKGVKEEADARYVEQLAERDTRASAQADTKAIKGLLAAEESGELNATERASVKTFVSALRAKSAALKSGDAHKVLEETASDLKLDAEKIRHDCDI